MTTKELIDLLKAMPQDREIVVIPIRRDLKAYEDYCIDSVQASVYGDNKDEVTQILIY